MTESPNMKTPAENWAAFRSSIEPELAARRETERTWNSHAIGSNTHRGKKEKPKPSQSVKYCTDPDNCDRLNAAAQKPANASS